MRKYLLYLSITEILFLYFPTFFLATHIIGNRISYECLSNGNYRVKILNYFDCGSPLINPIP